MSYPGYPSYPQAPGQQNNQQVPPAYQATAPLSYPVYPGTAAPQPYPYNSAPYGQPYPYPSMPYPSGNGGVYPGGPAPYPGSYPPSQPVYPPQGGSYPPMPQQSYPSPYPPQEPSGSAAYPPPPSAHGYGTQGPHVSYPGGPSPLSYPSTAPDYTVQTYQNQAQPTVRPANPFDPRADAEILRKAMKGFGTDEKALIQVLTNRSNNQRQEIAVQFKTLFGKDLISDLKSEVSGKFEDLLVALMTPIPEFLAKELRHAVSGIGTNEETLVEILCTSTNNDIRYIKAAYERLFGTSLENEMASDTSGSFRRLLVSLCQGGRSENYMVDHAAAVQDAQALLRAGELKMGTDESSFNAILCSRSYPQLAQVFLEYQRLTGHDFEKAIKNEFSGDIEKGLLAIVRSVRDKCGFFADQLYESMSGAGTKDRALIRIVVSRCEVDMGGIKQAFMAKYGKTVEDFISGDCSGDYKKALLSLVS